MSFKVQKARLLEGFKVARKTIGRSAKKADAKVELTESEGEILMRAINPGICQLKWSIPGEGDVPFEKLVAPLDTLRGVVERMPREDISIRIDPKNDQRLKIQCGKRSGVIPMFDEPLSSLQTEKKAKIVYKGEMAEIVPQIKIFDKVSLGGFNAWGCVCAAPTGIGYVTDEGNLYAAPFPVVKDGDRQVMIPTKILVPATLLGGEVSVLLSENEIVFQSSGWAYTILITYVQAPDYEKVVKAFRSKELCPIDITPLTREIRDFRKACKEGSLDVKIEDGSIKVKAARDAAIAYQSERDIKETPDFTFSIIPENYLKVGPNFKKGTEIAKVDGSHIFLKNGECCGIISCHAGSIKFL